MSRILYLDSPEWAFIKEVRWIYDGARLYRYDFKEPSKDELDYLITRIVEAVHDGCSKDVIYKMLTNPKFADEKQQTHQDGNSKN